LPDQWNEALNNEPYDIEHRLIVGGQVKWVREKAKIEFDNNCQAIRGLGFTQDITAKKVTENILHENMLELKKTNKELESFAYVASHDLKEPLRMITSYSQLLKEKYYGKLDDNANKYIEYAVEGSMRMHRLINDLLSYSRVGRQNIKKETVDVALLVQETLKNFRTPIENYKVQVEFDELPIVWGERTHLAQVFQNLISNAIKYRGKKSPHIEIKAEKENTEWIFSIKDNGIGIEKMYHDKIFIIFQRLHERGKYSGTGVGLAIVKKIISQLGGRIWVESEIGKGAIFSFTIPD